MEATRRILVVEDDPATRGLLARHLAALGCCVDPVADGQAALSLWERNAYDLVLTDIRIPGMNGLELIARIRASEAPRARSIPIIAVTGDAASEPAPAVPAGASAVMRKPFSAVDLRALLDRWLNAADAGRPQDSPAAQSASASGHDHALCSSGSVLLSDAEILLAAKSMFVATILGYLRELDEACAARDRPAIEAAAHTLKSSARLVGGTEVAELCETLERAGPGVQYDEIISLAGRIRDALRTLEKLLTSGNG